MACLTGLSATKVPARSSRRAWLIALLNSACGNCFCTCSGSSDHAPKECDGNPRCGPRSARRLCSRSKSATLPCRRLRCRLLLPWGRPPSSAPSADCLHCRILLLWWWGTVAHHHCYRSCRDLHHHRVCPSFRFRGYHRQHLLCHQMRARGRRWCPVLSLRHQYFQYLRWISVCHRRRSHQCRGG